MILVIGDKIQDQYTFCEATRLCPEAPAPVLVPKSERTSGGGAQLVFEQLQALVGTDSVRALYGSMSTKHRVFAGRFLQCRIDRDRQSIASRAGFWNSIVAAVNPTLKAVVVCDYGKGSMNKEVAQGVTQICLRVSVPLFVDAKAGAENYKGCFALFPNQIECTTASPSEYTHIIRKSGARGCLVDGKSVPTIEQQVFDETGAGDIFLAAFVAKFLQTQDLIECARYANAAAGISVRHLGTYVVQPSEIQTKES